MQDFAEGKVCPARKNGRKSKLIPLNAAFVKQMVRIMKLTFIFLLAACLQVSARGYTQGNVTLNMKNAPLEDVLKKIRKETGYNFFYQVTLLEKAHRVDIDVKNVSIKDALDICFKDQPLTYTVTGTTVVVRSKIEEPKATMPIEKNGNVKGRVINDKGEPLAGANIVVKRTGRGTITDANGNFSLKEVTDEDMITVSYVGYQPQSVKINNLTNLILTLAIANNELDETIIQAYGTTTRRIATGNIAKVTAAEIERQPVMNPLLALQGKVAGLDIQQTSGYASAPIRVELRGRNSINPQFISDPLYIIDGVPLTILEISGSSNYGTGSVGFNQGNNRGPANGQNPLFSINPADIESIEVLKDADATAIYGSRGANGVILITTKKGAASATKFNLNVQEGISKVSRFYKLLNTQQYLAMRHEAFRNDQTTYGLIPGVTIPDDGNAYDLLDWDTLRYTNWQKVLYGGVGRTIDAEAGLSGGNAHTVFRIGAGYNHTTNVLTVSGADQRATLSFNLINRSVDQRFSVSLSGGYSYTQSDMISLPGSIVIPPNAPSIYDSAGNLNYAGWGDQNSTSRSTYIFAGLKQPYTGKTRFLNSNLIINYKVIKGLDANIGLGYNTGQADQQQYYLLSSQDPLTSPTGTALLGTTNNKNWIIEPKITYETILGRGKLNAILGASSQQTNTDAVSITGSGYTSDNLIKNISSAPSQFVNNNSGEYKYAAIFGRVTYNFANKYILNLTARRDGSSRFGTGKQYGNFGSIGGAWIFSQERWFKQVIPFISFGKLRGSYGLTGSDGIGDYQYLTRWSSVNQQVYGSVSPLVPIQHANPDFQWQVNKKLEGALDLGLLRDRIHFSIVYYRDRVGNQLISFPLPALSGFTNVAANSSALVQNEGWEFTAGAKVIDNKSFSWSFNFNIAINKNKLVAYPNFDLSPYVYTLVVGQPLNIVKLLHYTGVDSQTGEYTFLDKNKDGTIDTSPGATDDRQIYNLNPKFFGGLGMDLSYKDFQLNLFFNIKKQIGYNSINQGVAPVGGIGNQPTSVLTNHWQQPGDVASIARFTTQPTAMDSYYYSNSDAGFTDASYIRLSNISLSYTLPKNWVKKIGLQACRLFAQSNNLILITKYKGIDPETQNFGGMPPIKTITGGISFNF